jgi:creatinine amidohydrolase
MHELERLSAPALADLLERGVRTAVVPFGSIEHQGAHLPLGADAILADHVGRAVATALDAVLVPTVRVGYAEPHMPLIGTLTVGERTLTDTAFELGQSLATHGLRVIALVSAHGGNAASLRAAADRLNERLERAVVCAPGGDVGPDPGRHSGEWLTSVMLTLCPELVDVGAAGQLFCDEVRLATAERGATHLERFVGSIVRGVPTARSHATTRPGQRQHHNQ